MRASPYTVRGRWISYPSISRGRTIRITSLMTARSWSRSLAPTYGCIVYQEQVMQIVRDLAGYTLGRSDILRRAMSKKKGDVMKTGAPEFCVWK